MYYSQDVCVDENEVEKSVEVKASARLVVPGYADSDELEIRRDSSTACRESINVLLTTMPVLKMGSHES